MWKKERSWGWYLTLLRLPCFCIKILRFKRGAELSRQKHWYRSEWWHIFKGRGYVGYKVMNGWLHEPLDSGDSHFIPRKTYHTFFCKEPVWMLEIQKGKVVHERDIFRLNKEVK